MKLLSYFSQSYCVSISKKSRRTNTLIFTHIVQRFNITPTLSLPNEPARRIQRH